MRTRNIQFSKDKAGSSGRKKIKPAPLAEGVQEGVLELRKKLKKGTLEERVDSMVSLGRMKEVSAVNDIIGIVSEEDESLGQLAVITLGKIGDASAISALLKIFNLGDEMKAKEAGVSLGMIGDVSAVPTLIKATEGSGRRLWSAIYSLGLIGDKSAIPALINAYGKDGMEWEVVNSLARIGDGSAVPFLIGVLKNGRKSVSTQAAYALGEIGGASAINALVQALDKSRWDGSNVMKWDQIDAIMDALAKIGQYEEIVPFIYTPSAEPRGWFCRTLQRMISRCESLGWIQEFLVKWDEISMPGNDVELCKGLKENELDSIRNEIYTKAVNKEKELREKK